MPATTVASDAAVANVADAVRDALDDVRAFVLGAPFQALLDELWSLPPSERSAFVEDVVLVPHEREQRGIHPPSDLVIQRSSFSDGRPTLFCVTKLLPKLAAWHKVTITFDNPMPEDEPAS